MSLPSKQMFRFLQKLSEVLTVADASRVPRRIKKHETVDNKPPGRVYKRFNPRSELGNKFSC